MVDIESASTVADRDAWSRMDASGVRSDVCRIERLSRAVKILAALFFLANILSATIAELAVFSPATHWLVAAVIVPATIWYARLMCARICAGQAELKRRGAAAG